jgi:phenylalanyl-tRNA synthetase beta subunit
MVRLVNSLLPNLFKNVKENFVNQDSLRFFEFGRVWKQGIKDDIIEKKSLAGIFFEKKTPVDFYLCKSYITDILHLVGVDFKDTVWESVEKSDYPWAMPYQTAKIFLDGKKIGIVGKVDLTFLAKLDVLPESDAFFFDLDGDFLINFVPKTKKFVPLLKYQETFFDLSLFAPLNIKTIDIESNLKAVSDLIISVNLIDFFEREEWIDKKSLTFRVMLADPEKTIEKVQIDQVWQNSIKVLEKLNIKLRD